jgi:Nif-specific regulatory protein
MNMNLVVNQRYRMVRPLGEGGMGAVHLAHDTSMGDREVALKILRPDALDPLSIDRFKDEFRSLARLRHPNLVEVYDFGVVEDSGRHFLSLEYIEGRDLSAYRWPASRDCLDELIVQCLRGLDYIHARGLLHNDIKPQNILVREPLQVKILDFGLAQQQADTSRPGLSGTIQYISPERIKGATPDARSDLYSLGVVFYELLTGTLPFKGEDPGAVISTILRGELSPPRVVNPEIPERVERLLLGLLSCDPRGRPISSNAALALLDDDGALSLSLDTPETVASLVTTGRFIGRESELEALVDLGSRHASVAGGNGGPRMSLIAGESGIGKSRLLRELKHRLQLAAVPTLTARCYEDGSLPFQPFVEILRQLPAGSDLPDELRPILEAVIPGPSTERGVEEPTAPGRSTDKSTFLSGLAACLDVLGGRQPGVLLIEDLQWCDAPGLDLFEHLLLKPKRSHWIVVGTLRGSLPLERHASSGRLNRIDLKPLGADGVADLLASMVPFEERPTDLARVLAEQTGGNPLYLEELVKTLAEEGALKRGERTWTAESSAIEATRLALSLSRILERQLASLSSHEREILDALAVFNRPASPSLLGSVLGRTTDEIAQCLGPLANRNLLTIEVDRVGQTRAGLAHSRIRQAVYEALSEAPRRSLHRRAGGAIEAASGDSINAVVDELAHHFRAAGDGARTAEYALRAADRARDLFYPERRARFLTWALESLPEGSGEKRLSTMRNLAWVVTYQLADYSTGLRHSRTLENLARAQSDRTVEAKALRFQSWAQSFLEGFEPALELANRSLALARKTPDEGEALAPLGEARSILESLGNQKALGVLNNESTCHLALGDAETARNTRERALVIARERGNQEHYYEHLGGLAVTKYATGDLPGALASIEEALTWAREHANINYQIHFLTTISNMYAQRGLFDRAASALEEQRVLLQSRSDPQERCENLDYLGGIFRALGRYGLAEATHREGLKHARESRDRKQEGFLLCALANDLQESAGSAAESLAREALTIGRETQSPRIAAGALGVLALVAAARGDRRASARIARQLAREDSRFLASHERLHVNLVLGRCALRAGKTTDAKREARAGLAATEGKGFREYQWRFYDLLGEALDAEGLYEEAQDAYNSSYSIIREVASEIEDPAMREDYEKESARRKIARRVAGAGADESAPSVGEGLNLPVNRLTTIYKITQMVNSTLVLEQVLDKVMDLAIEIVRAERGLVFLYRSETDEMNLVVARNMEGETIDDATEYSRSILKEAGRGRPILSHDAESDTRFKEFRSVSIYHIHSLLCVPLIIKQRVIGTVYVDTRQPGVVFSEDDLHFLEAFANQAAIAIENARLYEQIQQENRYLRQAVQERYGYESIIGRSPKMQELFDLLSRVAPSNLPVVIQGESGTGKELVARAVHHNSPRKDHRFFSENCAALPDTLLESELFGHVKGAFTGADSARKGLFEMADGGTLFLDEVGDMSATMQSKLLRVLQDGEIRPVGSETPRRVDVRIISATNRDLETLVKEKKFREDLYFRLNVISLKLPALRDRRDDIPLLADHFLSRIAEENRTAKLRVEPGLMALLSRYDWPGNVRELENQISRLVLFANGDTLTLEDAKQDADFYRKATLLPTKERESGLSREAIEKALADAGGNREEAARALGISRATMFRKLKRLDLPKQKAGPGRRPTPRSS